MPAARTALARGTLALAVACGASSCAWWRDWSTYRRLVAHEEEHAAVEIARYDLRVGVQPAERTVHVSARVTLRNRGERPLERVRFLLHPAADLGAPRCDGLELDHESRIERLGGLAALAVEVRGFPPIESGGERELALDYAITAPNADASLQLADAHGYLLRESLWAPTLRTPLSETGMDRAPMALEIALPRGLEPVGLPDFEAFAGDEHGRTFRGASDFPFAPFLAYGAFARAESADGRVRAFSLAPASAESADFVLGALAELRTHFEAAFGPAALPRTQVAVVRRFGGSWGAPCCILLDESVWPSAAWQQRGAFELLAHELAHTWWGSGVAMHGRGGYLHEGLANWCSADALRARYGASAEARAYEVWLVRYARGATPLGIELADVSILDDERYRRGAYLVGAHFYRALAERIGRQRFVALLRRFHAEFAFRSADLDDLRALATRECGGELEPLFERWVDSRRGSDELYARGRELVDARTAHWRARAPEPRAELRERVERALETCFERAAATDIASRHPSERFVMAPELFRDASALPELQATVIDERGDLVFHAQGLTGNVLGHRDVRGDSVYGAILRAKGEGGSLANFDFLSDDLRAARENLVAWRKLGPLAIVVEGHEWRALDDGAP